MTLESREGSKPLLSVKTTGPPVTKARIDVDDEAPPPATQSQVSGSGRAWNATEWVPGRRVVGARGGNRPAQQVPVMCWAPDRTPTPPGYTGTWVMRGAPAARSSDLAAAWLILRHVFHI